MYYIKKDVCEKMMGYMKQPEMGGIIVMGEPDTITDFFPCKNIARRKLINYEIGFFDRVRVFFKILKADKEKKFHGWATVHSHESNCLPSERDCKGKKTDELFMIYASYLGAFMLYKIVTKKIKNEKVSVPISQKILIKE